MGKQGLVSKEPVGPPSEGEYLRRLVKEGTFFMLRAEPEIILALERSRELLGALLGGQAQMTPDELLALKGAILERQRRELADLLAKASQSEIDLRVAVEGLEAPIGPHTAERIREKRPRRRPAPNTASKTV